MKSIRIYLILITMFFLVITCNVKTKNGPTEKADIIEFLGQWTIDNKDGAVSWLEVRQEKGYLDADLLWIAGSVDPVADVYLASNQALVVTRTNQVVLKKDENKSRSFAFGYELAGYS